MKSFEEVMTLYHQQHRNNTNKLLHQIGIPAIIFGAFMLLNWVNLDFGTVWKISFAWLVLILGAVYYFMLGIYKLASATTVIMIIVLFFAAWVAGPYPTVFSGVLFLILFFGGWGLLFAGHGIEKNKPAFMKSIEQILVAPLFLVLSLMQVCGLEKKTSGQSSSKKSDDDGDLE